MEVGIGMFADICVDEKTGKFRSTQDRLHELIEEIKLADELGIDVFSLGEHHRPDYAVSNPEIVLAAAATVTKNIILSSGVTVLSSADPVRIYQNFATIDLISNGRSEITAGRGSFTESFPLFGYDLSDYNLLFEEKLDLLLKVNEQENLSWKGTHRSPMVNQTAYPRALNDGKLPVWIAVGGTPESVLRAAKLGLPIIFAIIGGMPKQFKPLIEFYKKEYLIHGHDPEKMEIGVHSHALIGRDSKKLNEEYYPRYAAQMDRIGKQRGWQPYSKIQFEGGQSKEGALFIGEPEEVAEKILYIKEMFGLTRFVAHMDVGDPDFEMMKESIELYAREVAPLVR